jgi:hypothetical protein
VFSPDYSSGLLKRFSSRGDARELASLALESDGDAFFWLTQGGAPGTASALTLGYLQVTPLEFGKGLLARFRSEAS